MVPCVGQIFTDLQLEEAFREYDEHFFLSRRRFVPPNFAEIRHILNIAQVPLSHPETDLPRWPMKRELGHQHHLASCRCMRQQSSCG